MAGSRAPTHPHLKVAPVNSHFVKHVLFSNFDSDSKATLGVRLEKGYAHHDPKAVAVPTNPWCQCSSNHSRPCCAGPMSRLNIREANEHLQQLHQRVYELENQLQLQAIHVEELQRANGDLEQRVHDLLREKAETVREKDSQLVELGERLAESEDRVQQLLEAAHERDSTLLKLEKKARLFYEVLEHKGSLVRILEVLEHLSEPDGFLVDGPSEPSKNNSPAVHEPCDLASADTAHEGRSHIGEQSVQSDHSNLEH